MVRFSHMVFDDRANVKGSGDNSKVAVVALFATLFVLCATSVAAYIRVSMKDEDMEISAEGKVSRGNSQASITRDDSGLGLSTGRRPTRLARRSTIAIVESRMKTWNIDDNNETMGRFTFVVNMFADLCPPGFLPLANGLAKTGYIPGFIILLVFYSLCVYTMFVIARTAEITGAKDFAGQWGKTIGQRTSWVPVAVVVLVCFGCNLAYSCFFADIFSGVMPAFGLRLSRANCLLAFTLFPLLPLCLLKNLSALSHSSTFALFAVLYTTAVMVVRSLDGSYLPGGWYIRDVPTTLSPKVPSEHLFGFGWPSLSLVNCLAVAFLSHYNGCKYYRELERHTPSKLLHCTATAMGICVLLFAVTMVAGFQTFGSNADAVILQNYSEKDTLVNFARFGVGLSIIASFPLMFSGLREAVIVLLKQLGPQCASDWDTIWRQDVLSMCLLALITVAALVVTDTSVVVGLVGAICGSAIIYIVPCSLYAASIHAFLTNANAMTVVWLKCLILLGVVLAVGGSLSTLSPP